MPASASSDSPVDLRSFVTSVSALSPSSSLANYKQLTESASTLLDTQPVASREAVLALWASLADLSLDLHLSGAVVRGNLSGRSSVELLSEMSQDLSGRMELAPISWAPHLAKQALGVLGELSAKYTAKLLAKASKPSNLGLHEALPLWLECPSPRTLLDVTAQCLRVLEQEQELTEACVSVLLDISVKHSPNFDWVVAHIGGCFPHTVITRVLNVGLKEFCQSAEQQMNKDGKFNVGRVPKLNSVVGILGHLAVTHRQEIGSALGLMLDETLLTPSKDLSEQSEGIIPYLLNLVSKMNSPVLFQDTCLHLHYVFRHLSLTSCVNRWPTTSCPRSLWILRTE